MACTAGGSNCGSEETAATVAAGAGAKCWRRSAAAARSPGNSSPRSVRAIRMKSGSRRRNSVLKKMLASLGRRDCITAKSAEGRRSPSGGKSRRQKHC